MKDITKTYEFQQLLHDAAQYRVLRRVFEADRAERSYVTAFQSTEDKRDERDGA